MYTHEELMFLMKVKIISILLVMITIFFAILKLVGLITWGWLWVLAPIWIPVLLAIPFIIICICIVWKAFF